MQMSIRRTAAAVLSALTLTAVSGVVPAAGIDDFQAMVNKIAAEKGVLAPDVKKELLGKAGVTSEEEKEEAAKNALKNVSPIERIVAIDTDTIRAIKSRDGKLMFLVDNGRFAFLGKMIDVWSRKELTTIEDIADAVSHIDLARMGFKLDKVNHISVGAGPRHITAFVDPQCGWCHKLIAEINAKPELQKDYTFDFVVVPVLGQRSEMLAKKIFCADADDAAKYRALTDGARSIEALKQKDECPLEVFAQTRVIAQAVGVQGVPMVISHDGRFERGKPRDLMAFLEPKPAQNAQAQQTK